MDMAVKIRVRFQQMEGIKYIIERKKIIWH